MEEVGEVGDGRLRSRGADGSCTPGFERGQVRAHVIDVPSGSPCLKANYTRERRGQYGSRGAEKEDQGRTGGVRGLDLRFGLVS